VGGELTFPSLSIATIDHVAEPVVRGNGPGIVASYEPPLKLIGSSVGLVSPGSVSETVTDETPARAVTVAAKFAGWLGRQVGTFVTATDGGGSSVALTATVELPAAVVRVTAPTSAPVGALARFISTVRLPEPPGASIPLEGVTASHGSSGPAIQVKEAPTSWNAMTALVADEPRLTDAVSMTSAEGMVVAEGTVVDVVWVVTGVGMVVEGRVVFVCFFFLTECSG